MRIHDTVKKALSLVYDFEDGSGASSVPVAQSPLAAPSLDPTDDAEPTPRPAARTTEQIVRESPGPNLDQIAAPVTTPDEPILDDAGAVHCDAIYRLAQLPASAFTAEQVLELLASFPAELPMQAKRAAVKVTLDSMARTMGVNSEMVVADASRKLKALATYAQWYAEQSDQAVARANADIESLKAEIAKREALIADAHAKSELVVKACTAESDRLDEVLEFFSLDVAPSKYAPPAQA